MLKRALFVVLLSLPAVAWAVFKPVRVLAPGWVGGVSCVSDRVCLDDASRAAEAERLYRGALGFVERALGPFAEEPRVTFCSTQGCFRSFGADKAAGIDVGDFGIVIGPRGWTPYYVRHEMIHHLQAEKLGVLGSWLSPRWFKEGMAYYLSADPRRHLAEPWQRDRARFKAWYERVGREDLWKEARKL
ncbi:MAG TPA: hypothetical protein VKA48_01935 [Gammaproteobacteria bacterium]|nr:hypothetical protein [Gammaproteobacteria bacterium]